MERMHRLSTSWLAIVLCMALLMTSALPAAAFAESKKTYTIKWKVNGETVKKEKVKKGEKPEVPEDPADYSEGKYTYVFKGWEPKVTKATKDMTYKAKFKKTERKIIITWLDDEGVLIDFTEVKYGKMPKHDDPEKKPTKKYTYVFDGWDPELVKAKEDATYTATFKKKARKYTITWLDDEGNVIDKTKVAYGKLPEHEDPVKKSEKYDYTFKGWEPALTEVTGDATYTATFEKGGKKSGKYTITWLDDEGNLIDTTEVKKGKKPTHDDPTKEPTEQYTYTFTGWEPKVVKAKEDATYTATFEQKTRQYKITWLDDEGNLIDETEVAYGEMPTHADPTLEDSETHSYVFKGWEPELAPVTGEATYTAVFDEVPKESKPEETPQTEETTQTEETPQTEATAYTITWLNEDGSVFDTTTVVAGEVPAHDGPEKAATEQYSYAFAGWTPEIVAAEADAAYTATFSETLRSYAIAWLDDAGNPIDTTLVPYGEVPAHDAPEKAATEQYTYTFAGWTPEPVAVTGEAAYTATFTETEIVPVAEETLAEVDDPMLEGETTVKITVDWNYEGSPTTPPLEGTPGDKVAEPEKPDRDGYVFDYWEKDGAKLDAFPATFPDADITVKAIWAAAVKITVDWNYEGATPIDPLKGKPGAEVTEPEKPDRDGYVFDYWEKDGAKLDAFPATFPDADITVKAVWAAAVTITADWNYEGSTPTVLKGKPGAEVTEPAKPERTGIDFDYWEKDGEKLEAFPTTFPDANITVKALWNVTITWVIDGTSDPKPVREGERPTHDNPAPAEGYAFAGWLDANNTLYQPEELPLATAPATYTARWKKVADLGIFNCYAYITSGTLLSQAVDLLFPKEYKLGEQTVKLDWTKASSTYVSAGTGVEGDGTYTFTLAIPMPDETTNAYTLEVIAQLVVGPKTSETVGTDKTKNTDYEYRWRSLDESPTRAIITKWSGEEVKEDIPQSLTIASVVDGISVGEIGKEAFKEKKLAAITVPADVTAIGDKAFAYCPNLESLTLPDSLTSVGSSITAKGDTDKPLTHCILSVSLQTTLDKNADGKFTICHVPDAGETRDPATGLTTPVVLSKAPTDLYVYNSAFTLNCDFSVKAEHEIYIEGSAGMTANGALSTEYALDGGTIPGEIIVGGTLTCNSSVTNKGELFANVTTTCNGSLDNSGSVYAGGGGGTLTCNGSLTNTGVIEVLETGTLTCATVPENKAGGSLTVDSGAKMTVSGLTNSGYVGASGTLKSSGSLTNSGSIEVTNMLDFGNNAAENKSGGVVTIAKNGSMYAGALTNSGSIEVNNTLDCGSNAVENKSGGVLTVAKDATMTAGALTNAGKVSDAGKLDCSGNLTNTGDVTVSGTMKLKGSTDTNKDKGTIKVESGATLTVEADCTLTNSATVTNKGTVEAKGTIISCPGTWNDTDAKVSGSGLFVKEHVWEIKEQTDGSYLEECKYCHTTKEFTTVKLQVTYKGEALTKEYDLTRNVFKKTSTGGYAYAVTTPKASDFTLTPVKGSDWVQEEDSKNIQVNVASIKAVEQFAKADVGTYELKFTFGLKGDNAKYYAAEPVTVPATITAKPVEVTPRAGVSKVYGTKDPVYPDGSWLSKDETSPLHQDISGVPGYGVPVNVKDGSLQLDVTNQEYLLAEAKLKGTKFFPNDGWLDREAGEDVGTYKITIGKMSFGSNFKITLKDEVFTITAKPLSDANITVDAIENQKYTGKAIEPEVTVRYGDLTLKKDTDYTVAYSNNTEAGTAKVTLTGKGNYTGTREVTFTILKTSDSGGSGSGSSGGGSSGSSYDYDGFDTDDEDEDEDSDAAEAVGILKLDNVDYGTILFGDDGLPRPFAQFEDEIEPETEETEDETDVPPADEVVENITDDGETAIEVDGLPEEATPLRRLTIVPEPMKEAVETEVSIGEDGDENADDDAQEAEEVPVYLEGTQRERYEELHLRLSASTVQALVNNGVSEIVYELEKANMVIPLTALTAEIPLNAKPADGEDEVEILDDTGEEIEVDDEIEIDDDYETVNAEDTDGLELDDAGIPVDGADAVETMTVEGYDICIQQADATGFTEYETGLIADNKQLTPAYRVRVHVIPVDAEQIPTGEVDENDQAITQPLTEPLPEGYTLPDTVLKVEPYDSYESAPTEAQVLFVSSDVPPEAPEANGVEESAEAAEDQEEFEESEDIENTEDAENAEGSEETGAPAGLSDPLAVEGITLTPAAFDEEDDPIKVQIAPIENGMYATIVPPDWDPSPYLPNDEEAEPTDEAGDDEVEVESDEDEFEDETGDSGDAAEADDHVYEYAFIRGNMEYQMYYVFDTDDMVVRRFVTNDTGVMVGSFTGDAETGFEITWKENWKEKFKVLDERKAVLIDKDGAEWEYRKVDVEDAESVLNQPGYHDIKL